MKKFLLTLALGCLSCVAMFAQTYNETIAVKVNGNSAPESVNTIEVTKHEDNTCDFLLRNFVLKQESADWGTMDNPVGNINLKGVKMVDKGDYYEISTEQTIQIEPGDDPAIEGWMGPSLPAVPIVLNGKMDKEQLYASIQIDLMVMKIDVTIGNFFNTYEENIVVAVNDAVTPEAPSKISVKENTKNSTCDFTLRNFVLKQESADFPGFFEEVPVGNIVLKNVEVKESENGIKELNTTQNIKIEPGDDPNGGWLGPMLPEIPIVLHGKMDIRHMYATINIDLSVMGMQIKVTIGKDGEVTSIQNVTVNSTSKSGVYNLNGIRVAEELNSSLPSGIYIVDGKKCIVK